MSGYNMESFLRDFASRTVENLGYIDLECRNKELFEVTQLINSLLGLVIIPVEAYKKTCVIDDRKLKATSKKDYDTIEIILERCKNEKRLFCDYIKNQHEKQMGRVCVSKFISHLRNSVAHGGNNGIHFYPVSESEKISEIIFYDNNECNKKSSIINEFCIKLTLDELRELVNSISNLYCKFEKKDQNASDKQEKYQKDIKKLERLMHNGRSDMTKVTFELEGDETLDKNSVL